MIWILVKMVGALLAVMIGLTFLKWKRRSETRPCWFFGHDKRWLAIKTVGCVSGGDGKPFACSHDHQVGDRGIYKARWACRRCPGLGEDCLDSKQDWTIEHEGLVPDTKKWANWSRNLETQRPPVIAEPDEEDEKR